MTEAPLLSFCVPTYNRPKEFERLLTKLIPEFTNEVEIVIRDDSSDTATKDMVERIIVPSGLRYQYHHGNKEGIDVANIFIAEHAKGKFVWWCGDDDEVIVGTATRVLELIRSTPDLSFIFLNSLAEGAPHPSIMIGDDRFFENPDDFLSSIHIAMTLLSTGVFRREDGIKGLPIARKYIGTAFASQPILLAAIAGGGRSYYLSGPCILNHPTPLEKGKNLFYDGVQTFGVTYVKILNEFKDKFSRSSIRTFHRINFGHLWRGLVVGWIRRDTEAPRRRLAELFPLYWSYPEMWLALFVYLLPKPIVSASLTAYKRFVKHSYRQLR